MSRKLLAAGILAFFMAAMTILFSANPTHAYTTTNTVWRNRLVILWQPTAPGGVGCGSMTQPVRYTVTNPALTIWIAPNVQTMQAFDAANLWKAATGGIINYTAQGVEVPITWGPNGGGLQDSPGLANLVPIRGIELNVALTTRSDLWTVIPPALPFLTEQFDMYTTLVHEFGHDIGLHHRRNLGTVMTAQDVGRGLFAGSGWLANGSWGLPRMAPPPWNAFPGSATWHNPRSALTADDVLGAITLYTVPTPQVVSIAPARNAATGRWIYRYQVSNGSNVGSDHHIHEFKVQPVLAGAVITITPLGWGGAIVGDTIQWTAGEGASLPAGAGPMILEFEHPNPPMMGGAETEWDWPHWDRTGPGSLPYGDLETYDVVGTTTLAFDPDNAWILSENQYVPRYATMRCSPVFPSICVGVANALGAFALTYFIGRRLLAR